VGKESDLVFLVQKQHQITAAFERSAFLPGSIYVEARSLADIVSAISGMAGVNTSQPIEYIPDVERSSLFSLGSINIELGHWARVCDKGKYRDDLVHVLTVDQREQEASVLLVPRISLDGEERVKGKRKLIPQTRPSPSLFYPEAKRNLENLELERFKFNKEVFNNGLLELTFPVSKLRVARPSAAELELFAQSGAIHESIMTKAFSDVAAAAVMPGHQVRITSGEQAGLVGKVLEVGDGVVGCQSETGAVHVPVTSVRSHFDVGDYVQVHVGVHTGKHGGVIKVERATHKDMVTFTDDMSIKTGQLEQVSFYASLRDSISSTFSFRSHCRHSSSRSVIGPWNDHSLPTQIFQRRKTLLSPMRGWKYLSSAHTSFQVGTATFVKLANMSAASVLI
jgi:ribosomal protein L24